MQNAYIGRQVKHFEKVNKESLKAHFSHCKKWRYSLDMEFLRDGGRDKHLTIILKNPSSADELKADKTIATAERYIYEHFSDVARLTVLNIFAYRATLAKDIANLVKLGAVNEAIGEENNKVICQKIELSDYIFIAWGGNSGINAKAYEKRVTEVLSIAKNSGKNIFRNPQKGSEIYPFHACYWRYDVEPTRLA